MAKLNNQNQIKVDGTNQRTERERELPTPLQKSLHVDKIQKKIYIFLFKKIIS